MNLYDRRRPLGWLFAFSLVLAASCDPAPKNIDEPVDDAPWGMKKRKDEQHPAGVGELQVGVASRIIDGPVGVSMAGYGGRGGGRRTHWSDALKGTAGFYGMQSVKVVAIEVGDERMAFVKSPLMSSESYLTDAIARHLDRTHGLDFVGRVITVAGHSHHTTARYWPLPPLLGHVGADSFDAEVAETNAAIFADAIAEAWKNRGPGEWAYGYKEDWDPNNDVYRDRRPINDHLYGKDPRLSMLAFRKKDDATPLAAIINFPIHGTVLGTGNDLFTEDAPGYVEHKFEELFFAEKGVPIFGIYAQSSGGDTSPAGDSLRHPPLARLERIGEAAAPRILNLYDSLEWTSDAELAIRSERIELNHDRIYQGRPWENEFNMPTGEPYTFGAWQCLLGKGETTMEGLPKRCVALDWLLDALEEPVPHDAPHMAYITAARLGDVWMITIPGEPAYSVVKYAREQAAEKTWNGKPLELLVLGYAQDHLLYLTSPDDWYLGEYESEMSLWGPGGGVFFADQGLSMVDAMMDGFNGPALHEDSPPLAPEGVFEPRPRERSLDPGKVIEQPAGEAARTDTVRFAANCGDPALGNPYLRVQRQENEGFIDLPSLNGWEGRPYDNSRYEMVSLYDPDPPPMRNESVAERTHLWRFYWQVPPNWPAGTYRFQLRCNVLPSGSDSTTPESLVIDSTPFLVTMPSEAVVTTTVEGKHLSIEFRVQGVEQETISATAPRTGSWISAGYRLLDYHVGHTEPALVRETLQVEILDEKGDVTETVTAPFDEEAGRNVAELDQAPPADGNIRVWFASDATPSKLNVALPSAP